MTQLPGTLTRQKKKKRTSAGIRSGSGNFFLFGVPEKTVYEFTRNLSVLVRARIPLVEAMEAAGDQLTHRGFNEMIKKLTNSVKSGKSLAKALGNYPEIFDQLYIHLVETGEEAGILGEVLDRLAEYMEKRGTLKKKIRKALAYPVFIIGVTLLVLIFLLTVIVPTFAEMYADYGASLPVATSYVILASTVITDHFFWLTGILIVSIFVINRFLKSPMGTAMKDYLLLHMPVTGSFYRKSLITRFCQTLGTLLHNSIGLVRALDITSKGTKNIHLKESIERMAQSVKQGTSLSKSVSKSGLFPPVISRMITVGEETSELSSMLQHIAATNQQEMDADLEILTSIMEPAMIVVIGLIIGVVIVAMYLPVFELMNVIQ